MLTRTAANQSPPRARAAPHHLAWDSGGVRERAGEPLSLLEGTERGGAKLHGLGCYLSSFTKAGNPSQPSGLPSCAPVTATWLFQDSPRSRTVSHIADFIIIKDFQSLMGTELQETNTPV